MQLEVVRWKVVTIEGKALFALEAAEYEALSRNMAEVIRWTGEAGYQLNFYRTTRSAATAQDAQDAR